MDELNEIVANEHLQEAFAFLARELDVEEAKTPEVEASGDKIATVRAASADVIHATCDRFTMRSYLTVLSGSIVSCAR